MKKHRHAGKANLPSTDAIRLHPLTRAVRLSVHYLAATGVAMAVNSPVRSDPAPTALPVPRTQFATSGAAQVTLGAQDTMTIRQDSLKATLNWDSFDIGRNTTVRFDQRQGSASLAVNKIFQNDPSQIFGKLIANGQIYLINQNGILFGATSEVNVGGLIASSLDLTASAMNKGIDRAIEDAGANGAGGNAFAAFVDAQNQIVSKSITIDAGARLKADKNGQIMIIAPEVINGGSIETSEGQVVLAAGNSVYLMANGSASVNDRNNLRGFLVEVNADGVGGDELRTFMQDRSGTATLNMGTVTNTGTILAQKGNVTLAGLAVNQNGRVSATTSANLNGSIRLLARDSVTVSEQNSSAEQIGDVRIQAVEGFDPATAHRTGQVRFGSNSVTEVTPDTSDTTTDVDSNAQPASFIQTDAARIELQRDSLVKATGGQIGMTVRTGDAQGTANVDPRLYLESSSRIDASGEDIELSVAHNTLEVELRGTQLKDSPLQRDGFLYKKKVTVDLRQHGVRADGTPWIGTPVADISGDIAAIKRSAAERLVNGGKVELRSQGTQGDIVMREGSTVDVSGGTISYRGGVVKTTSLIGADGKGYDISQANPDRRYTDFGDSYTKKYQKWGLSKTWSILGANLQGRYEAGYVEGRDAGTVIVDTARPVLDGNLQGDVTVGPLQVQKPEKLSAGQTRPGDQVPVAGTAIIGDKTGGSSVGGATPDYRIANLEFSRARVLPSNFDSHDSLAATDTTLLSPELFGAHGMGLAEIYANGRIEVPQDVEVSLRPGGALILRAGEIDVDGAIRAAEGKITLAAGETVERRPETPGDIGISLGAHSAIDLRGSWINDTTARGAPAPSFIDGGSFIADASRGDFVMHEGSTVDVSAGARLNPNGSLRLGKGGNIALSASSLTNTTSAADVDPVTFEVAGRLAGSGFGKGGTLSLSANGFCLGEAGCAPAPGVTVLGPEFFQQGGFNSYTLTSNLNGISVADGAVIAPRAQQRVLDAGYRDAESGADIDSVSSLQDVPDYQRTPVDLSLKVEIPNSFSFSRTTFADAPVLRIGEGARIDADARAKINLTANTRIDVEGGIVAPSGTVSMTLTENLSNVTEYIPEQTIWLGSQSVLDVSGASLLQPNARGLRQGDVLAGGTVSLSARRGFVVSEQGSVIDVSGTSSMLDLTTDTPGQVVETRVASAAGSVTVGASEGMLLDGTLVGHGGGAQSAGGSLELALDASTRRTPDPLTLQTRFPTVAREIIVREGGTPVLTAGAQAGDAVGDNFSGQAHLDAERVTQGGFDALTLRSRNVVNDDKTDNNEQVATRSVGGIQFRGDPTHHDFNLDLGRRLIVDAARIHADSQTTSVALNAPYVAIGNTGVAIGSSRSEDIMQTTVVAGGIGPTLGTGSLAVTGNFVDVIGHSIVDRFGAVALTATGFDVRAADGTLIRHDSGDIRLRAVQKEETDKLTGSFATAANLTLQADQIYPSTLSDFTVAVKNNPGAELVVLPGQGGTPVLSAGSALHLEAPRITQQGVVKAPLGEIDFNAAHVTLADGSVTSVSAERQVIPFGKTQAGEDWVYGIDLAYARVFNAQNDPLPQKRVRFRNGNVVDASVVQQAGATIDVSGGGDLFAYEFQSGVGGSRDVLASSTSSRTFAVLPSLDGIGTFAPHDWQSYQGSTLQPGDSVYLSGIEGLPAGTYALLPARYALLPGAYLVTQVDGYRDLLPTQNARLTDGTQIISGYRTFAGTGISDGRLSGFAVRLGETVQRDAHYDLHYGNEFFTDQSQLNGASAPRLAKDAGVLSIAGASLTLDGALNAAADAGGRGAALDIAASKIAVVTGQDPVPVDTVRLDAARLSALGVESLLLGGERTDGFDGTHIRVTAATVRVDNDASSTLQAPELIVAAKNEITVSDGSSLAGIGRSSNVAPDYILGGVGESGDGALLRLSAGPQAQIHRVNTTGTTGVLEVAANATLATDHAILLDATQDNRFSGTFDFRNPGSLALSSSRVSLGEAPMGTSGLVLTDAQLGAMQDLKQLDVRSYSSLDLYGALDLEFNNLSLQAAHIDGHADAGVNATLSATNTLTLSNPNAASAAPAPSGSGTLTLQGERVVLGAGKYDVRGFDKTSITATREIVGEGETHLNVASALTLDAPRLTGAAKSHLIVQAADAAENPSQYYALDLVSSTVLADSLPAAALGARLHLIGEQIASATSIDAPSGVVQLDAKGAGASGGIVLKTDSVISVAGSSHRFGDKTVFVPSGRVGLQSDHGSVEQQSGAVIDLASSEQGGDAGTLSVHASQGQAIFNGNLLAMAPSAYRGGMLDLDVASIDDYSVLNTTLTDAGFTQAQSIRVRSGNVEISALDTVGAHAYTLVADGGRIDVSGTIDASGAQAGAITLAARDDITLNGGARLDTHATGTDERGGEVKLASAAGGVLLRQNSTIDVSGTSGNDGTVTVRLPRVSASTLSDGDAGNDRLRMDGTIVGAKRTTVEAYALYHDEGTLDDTDVAVGGAMYNEADAFMQANEASVRAALGRATDTSFHLVPGVEIRSDGDLTLASDWNLSSWRFNGDGLGENEAGVLTLRASGNLNIGNAAALNRTSAGALSDGFVTATSNARLNGESWSYRLIAGADSQSADPLAVLATDALLDGTGSFVLATGTESTLRRTGVQWSIVPGAMRAVRTGTGSIDIAAGRDIRFGNHASVVYTAGVTVPNVNLSSQPYIRDGGDIDLSAGGDIRGAATENDRATNQFVTEWLWRVGKTGVATGWTVALDRFESGVGALAGGNVNVRAHGDIENLFAAVPTIGVPTGVGNTPTQYGGGDLSVAAGGNIESGGFYVGDGEGRLRAGNAIVSQKTANPDSVGPVTVVNPVLALGDGRFDIDARGDVTFEGIVNPTAAPPGRSQPLGIGRLNRSFFFTYTPDSDVDVTTIAGDLRLNNNNGLLGTTYFQGFDSRGGLVPPASNEVDGLVVYPSSLHAQAFTGSVTIGSDAKMLPAPKGNLELLAQQDLTIAGKILLSDADIRRLPGVRNPSNATTDIVTLLQPEGPTENVHALVPVHADGNQPDGVPDREPVRLVAQTGDLVMRPNTILDLAKPSTLYAGRDTVDVNLRGQNLRPDDVTVVQAGRDIRYSSLRTSKGAVNQNDAAVYVDGPGQLLLQAGRDVDLKASEGVATRGNLLNPALAEEGAGITVLVGVGSDSGQAAFVDSYMDAARFFARFNDGGVARQRFVQALAAIDAGISDAYAAAARFGELPTDTQDRIVSLMNMAPEDVSRLRSLAGYQRQITAFVREIRRDALIGDAAAFGEFQDVHTGLGATGRHPLIMAAFFNELRESGRDAVHSGSKDYSRGLTAIDTLYPDAANGDGDLKLFFSRLYTQDGGDISFVVPSGFVNAGLSTPPSDFGFSKEAAQLGIVAQTSGNISGFARSDILVNQSRIFAADGGNILLWSSIGDIDAGRGAKTALSSPPPRITFVAGKLKIEFPPALTGSGIRAFVTTLGRKPGDADLFAPLGAINAGDAGIGADGNITVGAVEIGDQDNFDFGGEMVGAPTESVVGADALGTSNMAGGAMNGDDMGDASGTPDDALTTLEVEVVGIGGTSCPPGGCAEGGVKLRKRQTGDGQ